MLFAIDKCNNRVKATHNTNKNKDYYCPICKTKVIVKKGKINTPHFSHLSKTQCLYSQYYKEKASFNKHKRMIKYISEYFNSYKYVKNIELEKNITDNIIADIVVTLENDVKFIIECVFKKIDFDMYKDITSEYNKLGYAVLWVFDEKIIDI
ncbi:MAG: hypothetical protein IJH34_07740, partial [Romboutsia sp.]|nr:hypothetical protein [Romboutsia sp.]